MSRIRCLTCVIILLLAIATFKNIITSVTTIIIRSVVIFLLMCIITVIIVVVITMFLPRRFQQCPSNTIAQTYDLQTRDAGRRDRVVRPKRHEASKSPRRTMAGSGRGATRAQPSRGAP